MYVGIKYIVAEVINNLVLERIVLHCNQFKLNWKFVIRESLLKLLLQNMKPLPCYEGIHFANGNPEMG